MLFAVRSATRTDDNISLSGETFILKTNPDAINSQLSVLLLECFYCQTVSDLEHRSLCIESEEIQNGMYDQMGRKGKTVFQSDSGLTACYRYYSRLIMMRNHTPLSIMQHLIKNKILLMLESSLFQNLLKSFMF